MIRIFGKFREKPGMTKYLSMPAVWALSFGCAVGWGAFVMPGTTFLPAAGPWGTVIGLAIGTLIMSAIGVNYYCLMRRYPGPGGSYIYANKILGHDHGFICAWMLLLAYIAVAWANATALSLIVRCLFGDIFCFGFSYKIADYTVYMGEVLLSFGLISAATLICIFSKRVAKWFQLIFALGLFLLVCACFTAVVLHRGGLSGIEPAFAQNSSPVMQVLGIAILGPWAFIGFESISHSSGEFRFSGKKILPVIIVSTITISLTYIMLTLCASMAVPDGFNGWGDYIKALASLDGIKQIPTFFAAREAMGDTGVVMLGIAAFCGIATGVIGNFVALSRLICSMADDEILPKAFKKRNKKGVPWFAILMVAAVSLIIPFLGRTAIGWIVDVTTVGAVIVYAYISICAFVLGKRHKKAVEMIFGLIGAVISVLFVGYFLLPEINTRGSLSAASFFILIIWSILGILLFRSVIKRDKTRSYGKSQIVPLILFILIMIVSMTWIHQSAAEKSAAASADISAHYAVQVEKNIPVSELDGGYMRERIEKLTGSERIDIYVQNGLILCSLCIIFSMITIINKREQITEAERLAAEEKSKAKTMFLSNMSHDVRTPLNAVQGYTSLALEEKNLPDNVRGYLEKIDASSKHLLSLINDILDMSRIESGKVELRAEPADLRKVFEETVELVEVQMKAKNLTCNADCSKIRDRFVVCDTNRISRIMLNLLSNALKFTPSGGTVDVILSQKYTEHGRGVYQLYVADTGIGMSPEFAEHIFEAFERERTQTVSKVQGTGLGMTIAKTLVELMDGSITVETEQGKGTKITVVVKLPLTTGEIVREYNGGVEDEKPDLTGKKVLLVEDNMINREIALEILKRGGIEADCAEDGKVAVDIISSAEPDKYDIILMDIQMPVMNGYEAAQHIRAMDGRRSQIPIIALTANTFESDKADAKNAGMNAHVAKPFDPEDLYAVIANCLTKAD